MFVIDDSGSMQEEQTNLAANFPVFAQVIDDYMTSSGDALDYRIAITTTGRDVTTEFVGAPLPPITEKGDNGEFLQGCGMTRRWIERGDGDVAGTFACVANVGTDGPGVEMPLLALEWALDDRVADGTNAGFLRDDALLAVVILTDEDDCSREDDPIQITLDPTNPTSADVCDRSSPNIVPLDHYLSFLDGIKGDRGRWAVAVTAGPTQCTSSFGDAIEAVRLKDFVTRTGDNAVFSSICDGDLASALRDALDTFSAACENFPPID
ncbi:MAG: hypothetical protein D6689_10450 [Deltaproteobacteria bacterium]|nr:MAG: hypothetical protein D6689_10450 [Deltaproteobacteria bacterium]